MTEPRKVPPSFTPSGQPGRARPAAQGDPIPVRGGDTVRPATGGRVGRPDDAVPLSSEPRVRRQSSRETPVVPPERRSPVRPAPRPGSVPPAEPYSPRRTAAGRSGAAPGGAQRPRAVPPAGADGGTRLMPADARRIASGRPASPGSAAPSFSPGAAPRRAAGSAAAGVGAAGARAGAARPAAQRAVGSGGGRGPAGPGGPGGSGPTSSGPGRSPVKRRKGRIVAFTLLAVLVLILAWPVGLLIWANGQINHTDALSGAAATPGTTFLLAGSDAREPGEDPNVTGARADTIMVLHQPSSGPTALISIPRDSNVAIPGRGTNRINAAYAWGGPQLLVQTVEQLTGLTIDHYVEVGFHGVEGIVDAIGGVHLCLDMNVNEPHSQLVWEAGCHDADGTTALAFSRMRYQDPRGDIGRTERQQQVISAIGSKLANPGLAVRPGEQVNVISAGLGAITTDERSGIIDLGRMALAFRAATGPDGITGTPPLGAHWQLDANQGPAFWESIRNGTREPGPVGGVG